MHRMADGLSWFSILDEPTTGLSSRRHLCPDWDDGVIPNIILRDLGYGQGQS